MSKIVSGTFVLLCLTLNKQFFNSLRIQVRHSGLVNSDNIMYAWSALFRFFNHLTRKELDFVWCQPQSMLIQMENWLLVIPKKCFPTMLAFYSSVIIPCNVFFVLVFQLRTFINPVGRVLGLYFRSTCVRFLCIRVAHNLQTLLVNSFRNGEPLSA